MTTPCTTGPVDASHVLKAMGFPNGLVLVLVLIESCLLALLGGFAGLAFAWLVTLGGSPAPQMLPVFVIPSRDLVWGAGFALVLGLIAGAIPAIQAMRPPEVTTGRVRRSERGTLRSVNRSWRDLVPPSPSGRTA